MKQQTLSVSSSDVSLTFTSTGADSNLKVGQSTSVNVTVTNNTQFALANITLSAGDLQLLVDGAVNATGAAPSAQFYVSVHGGQLSFGNLASGGTSAAQHFFVYPQPPALQDTGKAITFSDNGQLTYDVTRATGSQPICNDPWHISST